MARQKQQVVSHRNGHVWQDFVAVKSPEGGLTVIATSVHGLLLPTCNRSHKLLATGSTEIKPSAVFGIFGTSEAP